MIIVGVLSGVIIFLYTIRKCCSYQWGSCRSVHNMDGKVVIITGANSGIGKETTRDLAKRGAIIIMACRNKEVAAQAVQDIRCSTGRGEMIIVELDLGNLESVRRCAANILEKFSHIDVLINNAGVYYPREVDMVTHSGHEIHFGVNHLGHFLFTNLLLDRIKDTAESRIVIVSSLLYKNGAIDIDVLGSPEKSRESLKERKGRNPLYADSKLCNILHGMELQRRVAGTGTSVYILCPGFVYTGLMRHSLQKNSWLKRLCFLPIAFLFMRGPKSGAQTSIYCAVSEELNNVPFGFFRNCKKDEISSVFANDYDLASNLWDFSASLVNQT